ncbi:choice-of-anchor J domain-containing protein [Pseudoduganella sp. LjRoot289]|uniref:choice-of-anchor J domain-containing protein n=1 Tax=Pseudoduganella sp. LjRoot289 TaxID=3342314 RepID=UPI003ECCF296
MKTRYAVVAMAMTAAILGVTPAQAAPPILSTGFDDVAALGGWTFINQSVPAGLSWFQGNGGVFPAQAGGVNAYVAANFLSVAGGSGSIDNWLITPQFSLPAMATLTFYTRGTGTPGFSDQLEVRYSTGGSALGDFSNLLLTVGGASAYPSSWTQYSVNADPAAVRFAFRYTGAGDTADYIGVDSLVIAAVPEPSAWLMLGGGLALLLWQARRACLRAGSSGGPGTPSAPAGAGEAPPFAPARAALRAASAVRRPYRQSLFAGLSLLLAGTTAMATAQDGMIMVRDTVTGAMRPATPAEFAALRAQEVRVPLAAPQVSVRADGTRQSRVSTRAVYSVATRDAEGKLVTSCVEGADAATAAVQRDGSAAPAQSRSGQLREEHSHDDR